MPSQPLVGIGITTYNRRQMLSRTIAAVRTHTRTPNVVFVADDGSSDDTSGMLAESGVAYLAATNRGIAWNKNRVLFYLAAIRKCDVVILLEDDTYPNADGWEQPWVEGGLRYGHLNLAPAHWDVDYLGGNGTVQSPYVSKLLTGQCASLSRFAVETVGYMDSRFRRYGFEHVEHTHRLIRSGFGGERNRETQDICSYLITSKLTVDGLDKPPDMEGIAANAPILAKLRHEPIYRAPWRGDEEMALFRNELRQVHDPEWTDRGAIACEPDWIVLCHNGQALMYDPVAGRLHGDPRHGDRSIPVRLRPADGGMVLVLARVRDGWAGPWLRLGPDYSVTPVGRETDATFLTLKSPPGAGFGMSKDGRFMCCDPQDELAATLSRGWLSDWETFRFGGYATREFSPREASVTI